MIDAYGIVGLVIAAVTVMALVILILGHLIGPSRKGAAKGYPYESGVPIVHETHRRFNIRFYIVALLFLLFDVEVVFMWPWAQVFYESCVSGGSVTLDDGTVATKGFLLVGMGIFFAILVLGLIYEWKKGAFQWD